MTPPQMSVSDFVAVFNQTIINAYPSVIIYGEVSDIRISRGRWVYFSLKDDFSSVRFFGSVNKLPGPVEDGMNLKVTGSPQLHPQFGFSVQIQSLSLMGEGTIKKAAQLLKKKLELEGLFDEERKRPLPYPPEKIGLIASVESAAYSDFIKVLGQRWGGIEVHVVDVLTQGSEAAGQVISAINYFNAKSRVDILVITRGGGSLDDLAAYNDEKLIRSIATSRIPTLVAVGHERDISLSELAADKRASTPSNAAETMVPDKKHEIARLVNDNKTLKNNIATVLSAVENQNKDYRQQLREQIQNAINSEQMTLSLKKELLSSHNPKAILQRGYALIRKNNKSIKSSSMLKRGDKASAEFHDGQLDIEVL